MSDTPARGAGVSEKSLPEPYEVWRPNRIRWSKNRGAYQEVTHTAFACLPGGDLGGDTIIATDRNKCATQLSVADAWAITAAISPRPTVRVAAVNEDGSTLNSYPPQYITPVTAAAPERPWAIYLTDREHAYRFLQMYMLTAFASLPLAFLGHDDTKSIGIGYLKGFASVAFTGVIIVVAVKMYQALLGGWLGNIGSYDGDMVGFIFGNFGQFFVAPIVLIFLLFGANGLAKKVIGEG